MLAFILRRILQAAAVMLTVALLAFVLFQYVGDPVTIMLGQDATDAERVELRERLGLDDAPPVQFARFVGNAMQGDFGISLRQSEKVSSLIQARLPATLELSLVAAILALVVGLPLGVYTALRRHGSAGATGAGRIPAGGIPAHLPDRHPADPGVFGAAGLAAQLRPRRYRQLRLVDLGAVHRHGMEALDPALDHAVAVPDDAGAAAGAFRNAGSAALGLHQFARARACASAPSISATR